VVNLRVTREPPAGFILASLPELARMRRIPSGSAQAGMLHHFKDWILPRAHSSGTGGTDLHVNMILVLASQVITR
jgi:hypothetical protein